MTTTALAHTRARRRRRCRRRCSSTSTMPTARSPLCALVRPRFRARSRTAMSIRQIPLSAASLSRAEDASAPPTRAGFAAFCLFASWTTETYSHVDRLWSITPAVYACMYALLSGWDPRCTPMALLTVMWGWRLTFNFARKGGYNEGEQDYRWPILRAHPLLRHPLVWQVFNFGFIASYQNLLLLLISESVQCGVSREGRSAQRARRSRRRRHVLLHRHRGRGGSATVGLPAEQTQRHRVPRPRGGRDDYSRGFLTRGLFRYSRHPNFFAEQCVWISYYVFSVAAESGAPRPRTGVGGVIAQASARSCWCCSSRGPRRSRRASPQEVSRVHQVPNHNLQTHPLAALREAPAPEEALLTEE